MSDSTVLENAVREAVYRIVAVSQILMDQEKEYDSSVALDLARDVLGLLPNHG